MKQIQKQTMCTYWCQRLLIHQMIQTDENHEMLDKSSDIHFGLTCMLLLKRKKRRVWCVAGTHYISKVLSLIYLLKNPDHSLYVNHGIPSESSGQCQWSMASSSGLQPWPSVLLDPLLHLSKTAMAALPVNYL